MKYYNRDLRHEIIKDIESLALNLEKSKLIITTRTGEIYFSLDKVDNFEISPLNEAQIEEFTQKWLKDKEKSRHFITQIKSSPFHDTTIKPLTLAHLCAIYEKSGRIPDKPKTVYRKIINLLLEEWDEQRFVKRVSRYSDFEIDRKSEFLANLSYELTTSFKRNVFDIDDLKYVYSKIYQNYDLLSNEADEVASELESHTGLFIKSGYDFFEFVHKSIQEYLTAEYIIKLPSFINNHTVIKSLPNELAIAVSLSSNPSQYFSEIVLKKIYRYKISNSYISVFINRLFQEKVTFNKNPNVLVAFLSLYTKYFEIENLNNYGQMILIPSDPNFANFERILSHVCKVNNTRLLFHYYEEVDENNSYEDSILTFKKIKQTRASYPEILYSRKSFIEITV